MENEIQVDAVRARVSQLANEIEQAQKAASNAADIATALRASAEQANEEARKAQETADAASALVAAKKTEYSRVLLAVAGELQSQ
jgi:flagellar hook-basal body complex protein FliE